MLEKRKMPVVLFWAVGFLLSLVIACGGGSSGGDDGAGGSEPSSTLAVATPVFEPTEGTYSVDQNVVIKCETTGATIYYTKDGTTPTTLSSTYSSPIGVSGDIPTTIKAIAVKNGMNNSTVASAVITIDSTKVSTPQFSPGAGSFTDSRSVSITCGTSGATILYTVDGSTPTPPTTTTPSHGTMYSGLIPVVNTTIKAIAYKTGMSNSTVATARYTNIAVAIGGSVNTTISQFNGKHIYTIVAPQLTSKQEFNGPPSVLYSFTLNSTSISPSIAGSSSVLSKDSFHRSERHIYGSKQADCDSLMRETENEALASGEMQLSRTTFGIDWAAPSPIVVGTTWDDVFIVATYNTINTTCKYISDHAYIFVDNRDTAAMSSYLASYGTAFDQIYQVNHDKFGKENDTDGNDKVIIIFTQELTDGLLGYFYSIDKYPKTFDSTSNEGDIFYITTDTEYQGDIINGTLAHEFQHMIYFDEHFNRGVTSTFTWLNEALSQAAEYYNNYTENHLAWITEGFLLNNYWYALSLTHWTSDNYGYGAIFIRYLIDRFGDTAIKNMCSTDKVGIAAVENATGTDFNTLFNDFTRALVMSGTGDSSDPRYNFTTLDLPTIQPSGRGGLTTLWSCEAGGSVSSANYPYEILFLKWTRNFGTMKLTGTNSVGTAFGLSR